MKRTLKDTLYFSILVFGAGTATEKYFNLYFGSTLIIQLILLITYIKFIPIEKQKENANFFNKLGIEKNIRSSNTTLFSFNFPVIIFSILPISSLLFHIWTVFIAFSKGGFFSGMFTIIFPFVSEIYWTFRVWGHNDLYRTIAIIHYVGWFLYLFLDRNRS
ncbi:MAG: hypothetical protein EOP34_08310 [Rickettsiales bacterium]|nr:MAG: hypothetical protein EOP34_08310 [Rickettsiales bacterium]